MSMTVFQKTTAPSPDALDALQIRFDMLERTSGALSLAVAVYDTQTQISFRRNADRWFHAASTIKVAILLLDLVGLETVQRSLDELGIDGIDIRRGVEDERAFEVGINNRVTAGGLTQLLRLIAEERAFTPELSREMLDILHAQEFRNGIP